MAIEATRARAAALSGGTRGGALVLAVLIGSAVLAPVLSPQSPIEQNLSDNLAAPSSEHPLGCDKLGRDQLSRLLYGARVSLGVGIVTVAISVFVGVLVGAIAGYVGGLVDFWLMRAVDVLLAFPGILLAIALAAVLGPGIGNVVVALSIIGWTGYARLVRAEVRALARREHVRAAVALGASPARIVALHVLPLVIAPLSVQATFGVAGAIVGEASLSFLGLGVRSPTPSWGAMINDGRSFLLVAPHLTVYPGLAIFVTVFALQSVGDGIRRRWSARGA
jgi:peptide/nickel transport system permease protein